MRATSVLSAIAKSLVTTIIFFAVAEVALRASYAIRTAFVERVPLPYSVGDDYGPIPPWLDRLMILVPDDQFIWRNLPNVRRTYVDIFSPAPDAAARTALLRRFRPTLPPEFRDSPTWTIALNSRGYRTGEFARAKAPGVLRIACVGDSWTFGMNVDQDRTYPSRLAADLGARAEVLNFGVLGYSSFQGRRLLESRVLDLHPDVVLIGFGMNDSEVAGYRDRDMVSSRDDSGDPIPPSFRTRLREQAADLEFYKLLKYFALALRFHPKSMGDFLREQAHDRGSGRVDYSTIEPWTRVSPQDYDSNLREMIRGSRARGASVVLLDNELWEESPYRNVLKTIAADTHAPLVDSLRIVYDARAAIERSLERELGLAAAQHDESAAAEGAAPPAPSSETPPGKTRVVFRVSRGRYPVPRALSIAGTDRQLGDATPNTILMHDDGTEGDERAGDGVWSLSAAFAAGARVSYVYTNSGAAGRWEGLDVPHIRTLVVPASRGGAPVYLPIETFGRLYMQADDWHTDAQGYDLIARSAADAIARLRVAAMTK
jgi:lysophospholipase L1-like esterase